MLQFSEFSLTLCLHQIKDDKGAGNARDGLDGSCKSFGRDAEELAIAIYYAQDEDICPEEEDICMDSCLHRRTCGYCVYDDDDQSSHTSRPLPTTTA